MTNNGLRDKVESKIWKDSYIITLIICLSLITIAFIFIILCHIFPSLGQSFINATGGISPTIQMSLVEYLIIYLIQIPICFVASFPLSALIYLELSTDKEYIDDITGKINDRENNND